MRNQTAFKYVVLLTIMAWTLLWSGCYPTATKYLPERFATVEEVFTTNEIFDNLNDIPVESKKKEVFDVSFEDVFRAAEVAVTNNMWSPEVVDKDNGLILALRVESGGQAKGQYFFYGIKIRELGPKRVEVIILAKGQNSCWWRGGGLADKRRWCEQIVSVQWYRQKQQLITYLSLIRNHLLSAGLI